MPDFLRHQFSQSADASPLSVLLKLLLALGLGILVAWIYVRTTRRVGSGESFPATLALLAVLIAMVTQVIGDNVARAFSLVGALSIVRFRTVVRDTKDTAYVIFAVVVGMAVGARNLAVALMGIAVIGVAMFVWARMSKAKPGEPAGYLLTLRVALGQDVDRIAGSVLGGHLLGRHMVSVGTMKQGASIEYVYETRLKPGCRPEALVQELNLIEGVQAVRLQHRMFEQES